MSYYIYIYILYNNTKVMSYYIYILYNNNNNTQIAAIALPPSTTHPQLWVIYILYIILWLCRIIYNTMVMSYYIYTLL